MKVDLLQGFDMWKRVLKSAAASGLLICLGSTVMADEGGPDLAPEPFHGWQFEAGLYGWLPDIDMTTSAGDNIELPLWQILQNLNFTAMGQVSAEKGRFGGFSDFVYMNLQGTETSTAKIVGRSVETGVGVAIQAFINTSGITYAAIDTPRTRIRALGGFRYTWIQSQLSFNIGRLGGEVNADGHVLDGIVGFKGETSLTDRFYVSYYGDIGTGQSDLTWQAFGGLNYRFDRFDAVLGYRYLDYDFGSNSKLSDMTVNGPLVGLKMRF
ncbi:hypothetical protein [Labrenzia sp. 011]|uniref:hypothetical protein n=1 Tax=Labrenzia sp. 011 TaxID=2171494 RepID=UPI0010574620|nr:hypothetical protein [Labrenzia sp. 011]